MLTTESRSDTFTVDGIELHHNGVDISGEVKVRIDVTDEVERWYGSSNRTELTRRSYVESCSLWGDGPGGTLVNLGPWDRLPAELRTLIEKEYVAPRVDEWEVCS